MTRDGWARYHAADEIVMATLMLLDHGLSPAEHDQASDLWLAAIDLRDAIWERERAIGDYISGGKVS